MSTPLRNTRLLPHPSSHKIIPAAHHSPTASLSSTNPAALIFPSPSCRSNDNHSPTPFSASPCHNPVVVMRWRAMITLVPLGKAKNLRPGARESMARTTRSNISVLTLVSTVQSSSCLYAAEYVRKLFQDVLDLRMLTKVTDVRDGLNVFELVLQE